MKKLIIIGAGGHGRVVADIAKKAGLYDSISFLDDGGNEESLSLPILGGTDSIEKYIPEADFFVAIGNAKIRRTFLERLTKAGASLPSLVHPAATIGSSVKIGEGTAIMAGAVVNPLVKIGRGVIINTAATVDHDSVIGDFSHVSVGAHLAGTVTLGDECFIGAGAVVINDISITAGTVIGAGAAVIKNITESGTYAGVPAAKKHD